MAGGTSRSPSDVSWAECLSKDLFCTLVTGFTTAAVFNPWDKALYLSVKENRPFLARVNWRQPFSGMLQAVTSRTLNTGLYFPLESLFHDAIHRYFGTPVAGDPQGRSAVRSKGHEPLNGPRQEGRLGTNAECGQEEVSLQQKGGTARAREISDALERMRAAKGDSVDAQRHAGGHLSNPTVLRPQTVTLFIAGNLAGVTCAGLSHPLSVTKYAYWNGSGQRFWDVLRLLYVQGGAATLYRGFLATMMRDSLFGGVFSCLRHHLMSTCGLSYTSSLRPGSSPRGDSHSARDKNRADGAALLNGFVLNTVAACVAVAASSPLNYVRTMQFAAPPDSPGPRMLLVLRGLRDQVSKANGGQAKVAVLSRNLLLGWGTMRAAVGMGFGSLVYDFCRNNGPVFG